MVTTVTETFKNVLAMYSDAVKSRTLQLKGLKMLIVIYRTCLDLEDLLWIKF